jgi:four helix bundle protein
MEENIIKDKSFKFALKIIELYKYLHVEKEYVVSKQILKSGTSIGANVNESISAQSRKDFISKMSIANKEARETKYWLLLLNESQLVKYDYSSYLNDIEEIIKILTSIVKTTQNN